ncbi:MAG: acyl carrier protein [Acidimicrobiales bacterium]
MPQPSATIREVLAAYAGLSVDAASVADDDDLYDAGLTSHASVGVMLALEDAFDVVFPEDMLRRSTFASLRSIRQAVTELTDAGGPTAGGPTAGGPTAGETH